MSALYGRYHYTTSSCKKNLFSWLLYGGFLVGIPLIQVIGFYHWIGLRENENENAPIGFNGKNHGFQIFWKKQSDDFLYGDTPFPHPSHWIFILEPMVTTGDGCTPGKFMQVDPMQQLSPMHGTVSGGCSKRFSSVINNFNDFKVLENMPKICKYCSILLFSLLLPILLLVLSKFTHVLHPNHSHTGFCLGSEICVFCNTFATRTNLSGCSNQVNPEAIKHFYTVGWVSPAHWISPVHFCFFGLAFDALHFTVPT